MAEEPDLHKLSELIGTGTIQYPVIMTYTNRYKGGIDSAHEEAKLTGLFFTEHQDEKKDTILTIRAVNDAELEQLMYYDFSRQVYKAKLEAVIPRLMNKQKARLNRALTPFGLNKLKVEEVPTDMQLRAAVVDTLPLRVRSAIILMDGFRED